LRKSTNRFCAFALWLLASALLVHLCAPMIYHFSIIQIKQQQSSLLHSDEGQNETQSLVLDSVDFAACYISNEQELEIGEMRYDLAAYYRIGNNVVCRVIADSREAKLVIRQRKNQSEKESAATRFSFWYAAFCQPVSEFGFSIATLTACSFHEPVNDSKKCKSLDDDESPPPENDPSFRTNIS
jgi:hypothetical protein